jgi:hypothetical protein
MNPYGPPQAKVADPAPRPGNPYKAVGLGLLTDLGGTFLFTNALALIYGIVLASSGVAPEEIVQAVSAASTDTWYFWVASLGGGACSVLGGYVCARIAGQSEYTLGVILGVIGVVLGVLIGGESLEVGTAIALNALTIVCNILGAWIGKKRNRAGRVAPA